MTLPPALQQQLIDLVSQQPDLKARLQSITDPVALANTLGEAAAAQGLNVDTKALADSLIKAAHTAKGAATLDDAALDGVAGGFGGINVMSLINPMNCMTNSLLAPPNFPGCKNG